MKKRSSWLFMGRNPGADCSLPALRRRASEIKAELRQATATPDDRVSVEGIPVALEACRESAGQIVAETGAALEKLGVRRTAAADYFRLMQATYGVFRRPKTPDPLNTVLIAMIMCLLEGGMTGAILISEGRMDVPAGLAYGLIFALVNSILGLLIGYLGLRRLTYRSPVASDAEAERDRAALRVRRLALFGVCAGLAAEAVLIFAAARLRVLGTHEGVFDFSHVGFWATFNDALALTIIVIGVCSVVLAVLKGYSGLDDPIPGFSEAYLQATADVDEAAAGIAEQAEETIEGVCDRALETAEDTLADVRDALEDSTASIREIGHAIDLFNDDVRSALSAAQARARKGSHVAAFVTGRGRSAPTQVDADAYEGLILPGIEHETARLRFADAEGIAVAEAAIAALEATRDRCLGQIGADLAAFESSAPNLDVLFDDGGDNA